MAKRHEAGRRTARENLGDLVDAGSFVEYGGLASPRNAPGELEELLARTPADGADLAGTARVNGELFGPEAAAAPCSPTTTWSRRDRGALGHRKKTGCSS